MRRGDAKPRRAAHQGRSPARLKRARGLGPRAFPAKRRTRPRPRESEAFAREKNSGPGGETGPPRTQDAPCDRGGCGELPGSSLR